MVDFRFDIRPLFPQSIIKVTSNLLPHTFRGDRRQCLDATSKMTEIIDRLGQLSATSQGLNKPVTTGQRLRMSENQTVYLLADSDAGQNGSVVGLLKVGIKDLYLFDETGQTRKVQQAPSILDFYVHESRQRSGLGKRLFQTMLSEEQWTPVKCSVDRPSEKLLAFLGKHYGLTRSIPQANNFVLFEGFFDEAPASANGHGNAQSPQHTRNGLHITNSPNTQLFGATYLGEDHRRRGSQQQQQAGPNLLQQVTQISPQGRYGARRPTCSMAESRHAAGGGGTAIGRKQVSEVSITPSQTRNQENPLKSPLDALSRSGPSLRNQNPFQRRSGLQDVDDSFLAANAFARPSRVRHSGLEREAHASSASAVNPVRMSAGQEPVMLQQQQQQPPPQQYQQQMPPAGGEQQQQAPPVAAVPSSQQQMMQQYAQQPAAGQPSRHEPTPSGRAHAQRQHQHMQQVPQQQQQQVPQQQQQQQPVPQQQQQQQQVPQQAIYEQQQPVATTPDVQTQNKYPTQQQQPQQGYIIHAGSPKGGKGGGGGGSGNSAEPNSGMGNNDLAEITAQLQQQTLDESNRYIQEPEIEPEEPEAEPEPEPEPEVITPPSPPPLKSHTPTPPAVRSPEVAESIIGENRRPPAFQLSKQHTGMKNRSFGVGGAVMPSSKMEFDQMEREDFGVVKINRPPGHEAVTSPGHDNTDAMSTVSSGGGGGLTDQGYYDLKFYHNKLCKREYFEQIYSDYML